MERHGRRKLRRSVAVLLGAHSQAQLGGLTVLYLSPHTVCEDCAASEYTLVQKLGQTKANKVFNEHWTSWFTQVRLRLLSSPTPFTPPQIAIELT